MNWMMGIGMGSSLIGNILDMFGIGKAKDAGDADAPADKKPAEDPYAKDWSELQNLYKGKGTFAHIGNEYICLLSNGKQLKAQLPRDLLDKIQLELATPTSTVSAPTVSPTASSSPDGQGGTVATKDNFKELFSANYVETNYEATKGLKVGNVFYTNVAEAYTAYVGTNRPVKASDITGTSITITDVIDNSSTIGDFNNVNASVNKSDLVKDKEISIAGRTYVVVESNSGYIILKDKNPTRNNSTEQTYILEQTSDGKYQLHQRENAAVSGYGVSAHN